MRWVTRKNAAVDRIACPWLVRRFIDADAEFLYVDPRDVGRVAKEKDATPFDVEGAELGHVDGRCSFESILVKYGLDDPGLARLARTVHRADVEADITRSQRPPASRRSPWDSAASMASATTKSSKRRCPCTTRSTSGAKRLDNPAIVLRVPRRGLARPPSGLSRFARWLAARRPAGAQRRPQGRRGAP